MRTTFLAFALVATLGGCGSPQLYEHTLKTKLDDLNSEMMRPAYKVMAIKPTLSNHHQTGMELYTKSSHIYVNRPQAGGPARVTIFLDGGGLGSGNMVAIDANGTCFRVEKGDCSWLVPAEWKMVRSSAITFANANGG